MSSSAAPTARSSLIRLAALGLLPLVLLGYRAAGLQYYEGFRVPQGHGMFHLLPQELAHYALFAAFGTAAVALVCVSLRGLPLAARLEDLARGLASRPRVVPIVAFAVVLSATVGIRVLVLGDAVLTDDEHAYRLIAQTLRTGALTAPSPGADLEFYQEQFVVLGPNGRYGKYTIGHPLLLALGQALGAEVLVVPLLAALVVFPLAGLARRLFDPLVAAAAVALYALSPQVWVTGASLLSQPASALCLACALLAALRQEEDPARSTLWAAFAGSALAFGVLVRPLPGALFVLPVVAYVGLRGTGRVARLAAAVAPVALVLALMLWINRHQSGSALTSGYQAFHGAYEGTNSIGVVMQGDAGAWAMSVAAALVRENFWLLGWPFSLAIVLLAGRWPRPLLLWGAVSAAFAYRLLAPKAGVGGAGPLYLFEIVPLLCALSAAGLARLGRGTVDWLRGRPEAGTVGALVTGGIVASLAMFLPPKFEDLGRMSRAQRELPRALAQARVARALVFYEAAVPPWTGASWAYFPPYNAPGLDGPVLFVRFQRLSGDLDRNVRFWRARYPDRTPLYFGWTPDRGPFLVGLEDFVRSEGLLAARR